MLIIGEKINVSNPLIFDSITSRKLSTVVNLAILQVEAGAEILDINFGPDISRSKEIMQEVVKTIQDEVDVPLCLNGIPETIEAGLRVHQGRAIINGVTGDRQRMQINKLVKNTAKTTKLLCKNHIYCDAYLCG